MHDLGQVLERKLPDCVCHVAQGLVGEQLKSLMHRFLVVAQRAFAKQLRLAVVGVPARVLDPAPHKVIAPWRPVGVQGLWVGGDGADLGRSLGRATLVGIQAEYPFVRAGRQRLVAQVAKALEINLHHARTQVVCNLGGGVRAVGVDQHYLVGPAHALNGCAHFLRFVERDDVDRNLGHL